MSTSCGVRALIIYGGVIYRFEVRFAQQEGHFDRQVVLIPVVLLWLVCFYFPGTSSLLPLSWTLE